MGGLNANLILQGTATTHPTQLADPLQQMETLARLKQYQQQGQLVPLQAAELQNRVALGQQQVQGGQDDRADDDTWQKALRENGGDFDKTRAAVADKVHPRNLQKIDTDQVKFQQAALEYASSQDKQKRAKWDDFKNNNEMIGQALDGVMKAPDAQKPAMYAAALARLQGLGVDMSKAPQQLPDDDTLNAYAASVGYQGKMIRDAERAAIGQRAKQQAANLAASEKATETHRKMEDAATDHVSVQDQAQHDQWLASLDPEIQPRFSNLKEFNPRTQRAVQNMALTTAQRASDASRTVAEDAVQRRLDILQQRADSYDRRADNAGNKPASKQQFLSIENAKQRAIAQSKQQLDKELRQATGGIDEEDTLWQNHFERMQRAQNDYEAKIGELTGNDVGHDGWADNLKPPTRSSQGTQRIAPPPTEDTVRAGRAADARSSSSSLPPTAVRQLKEGVDTTFGNGQVWTLRNGKPTMVSAGSRQ